MVLMKLTACYPETTAAIGKYGVSDCLLRRAGTEMPVLRPYSMRIIGPSRTRNIIMYRDDCCIPARLQPANPHVPYYRNPVLGRISLAV